MANPREFTTQARHLVQVICYEQEDIEALERWAAELMHEQRGRYYEEKCERHRQWRAKCVATCPVAEGCPVDFNSVYRFSECLERRRRAEEVTACHEDAAVRSV